MSLPPNYPQTQSPSMIPQSWVDALSGLTKQFGSPNSQSPIPQNWTNAISNFSKQSSNGFGNFANQFRSKADQFGQQFSRFGQDLSRFGQEVGQASQKYLGRWSPRSQAPQFLPAAQPVIPPAAYRGPTSYSSYSPSSLSYSTYDRPYSPRSGYQPYGSGYPRFHRA